MDIGRHRGIIANEHIKIGSNSYENVKCIIANEHIKIGSNSYENKKTIKYLGSLLINQNYVQRK
jgi:hypothetical protein